MNNKAPSPWIINNGAIQSLDRGRMYTVAKVGNNLFTDEANQTHARLIAAAPDLLDALCTALPFVEDHEGSNVYKAGAVARAVREIRAAIKAATGEA